MKPPPCVLTIAGSDSGGGAGVQADARTVHAFGGYACAAIAAITAQNTRGVQTWRAVASDLVAAQISAVLDDFPVRAIKTGLLPASSITAVAKILEQHPGIPLVIDPVIGSTSGTKFLSAKGVETLKRELLPRAALVTPNWPEAEVLSGQKFRIEDWKTAEKAAQLILESGCGSVLVKGGHAPGAQCWDILVKADGTVKYFKGRRIKSSNTHGTGCVLSAAIAAGLAQRQLLETAIRAAKRFLEKKLRQGSEIDWRDGRGPAFGG